jgi:RNA polymerase sigma factor (sigma-70 family)
MGGPGSFIQQIETLFDAGVLGELTDRQLVERFNGRDRTAADLAFAVLVKRHGPMVYRACRAILGDPHEAEDAFQATFLVLARKARGLWIRHSLGPWLLTVARRTATCARVAESRRRARERRAGVLATSVADDPIGDDRDAILHEELGRLPERYRMAVLLCDLEGLTQEQAARQLGCPDGTVRSRLARGRERLRQRLTRRGIAPAVSLAVRTPTFETASASVVEPIVRAAIGLALGGSVAGTRASVMSLMKGALEIMFWSRIKMTAAVAMAGLLLGSTGLLGYRAMGRQHSPAPAPAAGQQPAKPDGFDVKPAAAALSRPELAVLAAIGQARLEVAEKMRDAARALWQGGEMTSVDFLAAQKRYDEAEADVTATTDADHVRCLERQVSRLKQIEDFTRKLVRRSQGSQLDALAAELARLDAEYALAKAKAKIGREPK